MQCIKRTLFVFQSASDPPPNYEITLNPASVFEVDAFGFIHLRQGPLDYETRASYVFDVRILSLCHNFFFFHFFSFQCHYCEFSPQNRSVWILEFILNYL